MHIATCEMTRFTVTCEIKLLGSTLAYSTVDVLQSLWSSSRSFTWHVALMSVQKIITYPQTSMRRLGGFFEVKMAT